MAVPFEDLTFSDLPQSSSEIPDEVFNDIDFNDWFDPHIAKEFESRLAQDFPIQDVPTRESLIPDFPVQNAMTPSDSQVRNSASTQKPRTSVSFATEVNSAQPSPPPPTQPSRISVSFPAEVKGAQSTGILISHSIQPQQLYNAPEPAFAHQDFPNSANDDWLLQGQQLLDNQFVNDILYDLPPTNIQGDAHFFPTSVPIDFPQMSLQEGPQFFPTGSQIDLPPSLPPVLTQISWPLHIHPQNPLSLNSTSRPDQYPHEPPPFPQKSEGIANPSRDSYVAPPLQRSRHSKQPPLAETVTTSPPLKRPARDHHGEPLLNDRIPRKTHVKRGPETVEPERYYGASPAKPKNWGPKNHRGQHLFTYNEKGELSAGLFFTAKEMRQYLLGPGRDDGVNFDGPYRLPGVKYLKKKIRQGLTLWIGWPAAMANARYPRGGESTKCRFKNCRFAHTISVGDPWVIMDERQNVDGEMINPFHNAGYCHLFCLEHYFDIIDLWHCIDVRADYRTFKRETYSYFSLENKLPGIDKVLRKWWASAYKEWTEAGACGKKRPRVHETSLAQCLVDYKLQHEPVAQARNRRKRGGVDMTKHRGDPDMKRKLTVYKKYGLLDGNGYPVPDAEARCNAIINSSKRVRKESQRKEVLRKQSLQDSIPGSAALPSPSTEMRQFYPLADSGPLSQSEPKELYAISTYKIPRTNAGRKRSLDETAVEDTNEARGPSPKRPRMEHMPPATPPPAARSSPGVAGNKADTDDSAEGWIHDELLGHNTKVGEGCEESLEVLANADGVNIDAMLDSGTLDGFFGVTETVRDNGKLVSDTNDHLDGKPSQEVALRVNEGNEYNSVDDLDGLFGEPEY